MQNLLGERGVQEALRLSRRFDDGRALDSLADLRIMNTSGDLRVYFRGAFSSKPLRYPIDHSTIKRLQHRLNEASFDYTRDVERLPLATPEIWLIERAAGAYSHSLLVSPHSEVRSHAAIIAAVSEAIPQALREIQ